MAEGMDHPPNKKIKLGDGAGDQSSIEKIKLDETPENILLDETPENIVFSNFRQYNDKLLDLKCALTLLNGGFNKMSFLLTKFIDLNARSPVSFSRATCVTEQSIHEKYAAASIFQTGVDVLEKYLHSENEDIIVPDDERQRKALSKLLSFFMEDHDEFLDLDKKSFEGREGEWAYNILRLLLIKLAVDKTFVITNYPKLFLAPDESCGVFGDTSFGCEKGWHGSVDILLENNLPVQLIKPSAPDQDVQSESSVSSIDFSDSDESQLIAQTIVFSFLQHKYNKSVLKNFLIPAIGISTSQLYINLYDCENDVFLASEKEIHIMEGQLFFNETIVLLWLALNYRDFCTGITEEMRKYKADFHKRVDNDLLCEYQDNVRRPLPSTPKKITLGFGAARSKVVERSVHNKYRRLVISKTK